MIISDKHKLILTLPQKCATGTLQLRLADIRDLDPYGKAGPWFSEELDRIFSKHILVRDIVRFKDFKKRKRYFRASFVRNPYDRIYSWYEWFGYTYKKRLSEGSIDDARQKIDSGDDPDGVSSAFLRNSEWMQRALEESAGDFNKFLRMNPNRYSLASGFTHLNGKQWVNFIGRVETFEEDYRAFCKHTGINDHSHKNDSKSANAVQLIKSIPESIDEHKYLQFYDKASISLVNELMAADFELLGYKKF